MKTKSSKQTPTQKLKAENAALIQDIWTLTMSSSMKDMTACAIKWKLKFQDEAKNANSNN